MDTYKKLFKSLQPVEPSVNLIKNIKYCIARKERVACFRRLSILCITFIAVILGGFYGVRELREEVIESGFLQFVSLAFSDTAALSIYWKEFSLSLVESLPVFGIAITLGSIFILLILAKSLVGNFEIFLHDSQMLKKYGYK